MTESKGKRRALTAAGRILPGAALAAGAAPRFVRFVLGLIRDPRAPRHLKLLTAGVAAYIALPFDFLPAFVPLNGPADDLMALAFLLIEFIKACPDEAVAEHWEKTFGSDGLLEEKMFEAMSSLQPAVSERLAKIRENLENIRAINANKSS